MNTGLFVPLHFHSRERNVQRELSLPWNYRSVEHSLLGTFVPTFVPRERTLQSFVPTKLSFHTNIQRTFAPNVLKHNLKMAINLTIA